eukprot:2839521-Lingulodinium_polyedra.AAC.1
MQSSPNTSAHRTQRRFSRSANTHSVNITVNTPRTAFTGHQDIINRIPANTYNHSSTRSRAGRAPTA